MEFLADLELPGHMRFHDRADAGRALAAQLGRYAGAPNLLVLALPRGGVPVAFEVARALGAPLEVLVVRKLGVPGHEELAMGAIAEGGVYVLNQEVVDELDISEGELRRAAAFEQHELERRAQRYRGGRPTCSITGQTVILVDDGLATGTTMRAAITAVRARKPTQVIVAVPVAARSTVAKLRPLVDDLITVRELDPFYTIGLWYDDFSQTQDDEVCALLERASAEEGARRERAAGEGKQH